LKLPRARWAWVDEDKIVGYLLSSQHPDGRSKAVFFGSFGFSAARWELLADALRDHGLNGDVTSVATSDYGTRYSVDGKIETPDGRNPRVRTVWLIDEREEPRLITAHPLRRRDAGRT
jgi:hypothetical protein